MGRPTFARLQKAVPALIIDAHTVATVPAHLTFVESIVIGVVQGIAELFPVSSLGHDVLVPKLLGWNDLLRSQNAAESFWLAFVVGLHVANALALLVFFWRDWVRIIKGFVHTLVVRRIETSTERLAWMIVIATIPVGIIGLALEHELRTLLAKPLSAAIFLMVNGVILLGAERLRRRSVTRTRARELAGAGDAPAPGPEETASDVRLGHVPYRDAAIIGLAQSLALIAGISRDGVCMATGLIRGLDNEDAAKFAFLLSTPVILAAGVLKVSDLTGPLGNGVHGQILAGTAVTFVVSLLAIRFLAGYFRRGNLRPFGFYCLAAGAFMTVFTIAGG